MTNDERNAISRDLIVAAYEVLLGRKPENEKVVRNKMEKCRSIQDVLRTFLNSAEFRSKQRRYASEVNALYREAQSHVDVDVAPEVFRRLFERIRDQWAAMGES